VSQILGTPATLLALKLDPKNMSFDMELLFTHERHATTCCLQAIDRLRWRDGDPDTSPTTGSECLVRTNGGQSAIGVFWCSPLDISPNTPHEIREWLADEDRCAGLVRLFERLAPLYGPNGQQSWAGRLTVFQNDTPDARGWAVQEEFSRHQRT
jgi:hypothetical protein